MNWLRKLWKPKEAEPEAPVSAPEPVTVAPVSVEPVAFISDIHGNLQALQAVLANIEAQGVREVLCLGDIVGYGGNPAECVALIRSKGIPSIRGNHDAYAGGTTPMPKGRGEDFHNACHWMREQIGEEGCQWLGNLPFTFTGEDYELVHTGLHKPEDWRYMLTSSDAERHMALQRHPVSFVGHTHQPKMWIAGQEQPTVSSFETLPKGRKQVVDVGSVGQPRDGNPDACYVIFNRKDGEIRWRRVPYDIASAQDAISKAGLPPKNAGRLEHGK